MRKPKLIDFDEGDGNGPDYEAYEDMMDHYGDVTRDEEYDREMDRRDEVGDQIHEQQKDEKDE